MNGGGDKPSDSQFILFQDFSPMNGPGGGQAQLDVGTPDNQTFGNFSSDATGIGIIEDLQGMTSTQSVETERNFWSIEYYQKFFDVDTNDVLERIIRSIIPRRNENYLQTHIRGKPDLYGPFWICVTLVFSIAISGNMANYLQTANSKEYHWRYNFHVVSIAATAIFTYAWLLPIALWGVLRWSANQSDDNNELLEPTVSLGLLELLSLYGYSLAIYVPVAFLWTIQIGWLQWLLVVTAALMSGGVLVRSLSPVIAGKNRIIYIAGIFGMHLLLAVGFKLYFFHMPLRNSASEIVETALRTDAVLQPVNNNLTKF
ncbi:protein YIPF1 [Athalia rosae]|uniref:protein YIPF1 n=1 Tax=Athalia rosae TaxID=37344 RepID=UPI0020342C1E|nr:protein YIPF1 [Athalia rosae]